MSPSKLWRANDLKAIWSRGLVILFQFYVGELRINSVCSDACLLTLLRREDGQSEHCLSLVMYPPLSQPLFSGRKPIFIFTDLFSFFSLSLSLSQCLYPPFHPLSAAPQFNARIIPHLCQLPVVPTVGPATPRRAFPSLSCTSERDSALSTFRDTRLQFWTHAHAPAPVCTSMGVNLILFPLFW